MRPIDPLALRGFTPNFRPRSRGGPRTLLAGVSRLSGAVFVTVVLIAASAWKDLRIQALGLFIHPYLVAVTILFALVGVARLRRFPAGVLTAIQIFVVCYSVATIPGGGALSEMLKVAAAVITMITLAVCLDDMRDFHAGALGLNLAVLVMSFKGIAGEHEHLVGYNPLDEMANKNAFSLYALPAVLIAGSVLLDRKASPRLRIVLALTLLPTVFTIVSSANRSGWLGLVVIGAMLLGGSGLGRKLQATVFLATLGIVTYALITEYGAMDVVEHRIEQTVEGYSSDEARRDLLLTAFKVGFEHPLLGASPQGLARELATRLRSNMGEVDSHNIFGHLFGAGGALSLGSFLLLGYRLGRRPPEVRRAPATSPGRVAHDLVRQVMVLFAVRGMFTREVLYSPGFAAAFGLAIGLALLQGVWVRRVAPVRRAQTWTASAPGAVPAGAPVDDAASPKVRPFSRAPTRE